jgi:hypothetical protein
VVLLDGEGYRVRITMLVVRKKIGGGVIKHVENVWTQYLVEGDWR